MFAVSKGQQRKIDKLNCTYRFVRKTDPKKPENTGLACEIIDIDTAPKDHTGQPDPARATPYATGFGETEPDALDAALKEAEMAPKPMTKAQQARDPVLARKLREVEEQHYAEKKADPQNDDDEDYDPEPSDKRTREWRLWKQRQEARDKEPATAKAKED